MQETTTYLFTKRNLEKTKLFICNIFIYGKRLYLNETLFLGCFHSLIIFSIMLLAKIVQVLNIIISFYKCVVLVFEKCK